MTIGGVTILLVEDEPILRQVFRTMLEAAGYRVSEAGSAREAIETAGRVRPALVLLDLGLPDAPGLDVARAIRAMCGTAEPRIVAMTGSSGSEIRAGVRAAGCTAHLVKPVESGELLRRIPEWLAGPATGDPAASPA